MARKARAEVEGGFYHVIMNANRRVIELVSERTLYEGPSGSEALIRELGSGLRFFDSLSRAQSLSHHRSTCVHSTSSSSRNSEIGGKNCRRVDCQR